MHASQYYHMSLPPSTVLTLCLHLCIFPCLSLFVWLSSPDLDHQEWSLPSCLVHLPTYSQPQRRSNEGGGGAVLSGDNIVSPQLCGASLSPFSQPQKRSNRNCCQWMRESAQLCVVLGILPTSYGEYFHLDGPKKVLQVATYVN